MTTYYMQIKFVIVFLVSAFVGWIAITLMPIEYKTVVVYPSPDNLTKIQYKDKGDNCFEFSSSTVECTPKAKKIEVQ
jgi:hypothetical protein